MNLWVELLAAALLVLGIYGVWRFFLWLFCKRELEKSELCHASASAEIEVYAEGESLEYYVRLALAAADGKRNVIVYLKKDASDIRDMTDTVMKLRREHPNLMIKRI